MFAYFLLNMYRKNAATANALLIVTLVLSALFIVAAFDVFFLVRQSGRLGNFTPLLNMTADELITGFGFMDYQTPENYHMIGARLGFQYMDSMYAMVIMRSGIVGFCLFFVPLIVSLMMFFHNIRSMTKFQMATGALLVQSMFYFIAEKTLYEFSYFGLLTWTLYIVVANERSQAQKSSSLTPKFPLTSRKPRRIPVKILHNS